MNRLFYLFKRGESLFRKIRTSLWKYFPIEAIINVVFQRRLLSINVLSRLDEMLGLFDKDIIEKSTLKEKQQILYLADKAILHEYKHLGSDWVKLDPMIWNRDLKTGFQWPNGVFYKEQIRYTSKGADIKMPWDLSRSHHILWLSEAYQITKDEKYSKECINQIISWIDNNKFLYSVNWVCPMDVAIRASNWIYAIHLLKGSSELSDSFLQKFKNSLLLHGYYIRYNLEKGAGRNFNHYTADLAGLLLLGLLFEDLSVGRSWFRFAKNEIFKDILVQVLPTGVHYEKSISYHRLMVELYSYPMYVLRRLGEEIPKEVLERIQLMYDFISVYQKPSGKAPQVSDNDNGRFLPFTYDTFTVHSYLIDKDSLDNRIISNLEPRIFNTSVKKDGLWLYKDAGFAISKGESHYLFVVNSGNSRYPNPYKTEYKRFSGMHNHNDLLSFELSICDEDVFVDSGSYVYTANIEERNRFRSTAKHNTIIVDGEEQNKLDINAFSFDANSQVYPLELSDSIIRGSYKTNQCGLYHERSFDMRGKSLSILDRVIKQGDSHHIDFYLHLAPGLKVEINFGRVDILGKKIQATVYSDFEHCQLAEDEISPSYGLKEKSQMIVFSSHFDGDSSFKTTIEWSFLS